MIKKEYRATNGYHDITPGQTELKMSAWFDEEGTMVAGPTGKWPIAFNEVQISGDPDFRRSLVPDDQDDTDILLIDHPDYEKLFVRLQTMAGKQIPLNHSNDFVARWICLSLLDAETIERGTKPHYSFLKTKRGNWGGIKDLSLKRGMVQYIDDMDDETRGILANSSSSRDFARKFVTWREGIDGLRIKYRPSTISGGDE